MVSVAVAQTSEILKTRLVAVMPKKGQKTGLDWTLKHYFEQALKGCW